MIGFQHDLLIGAMLLKTNIFQRLLHQQSTDRRQNLENYLTEILCDFLNRLGGKQQIEFLKYFIGYCPRINQSKPYKLTWETRFSIIWEGVTKYPDLVGFENGDPLLIIESKIGANFTQHLSRDKKNDGDAYIGQLAVYGRWLKQINKDGWLVLLTKDTAPPKGFVSNDVSQHEQFGVENRRCTSWQKLYETLSAIESYTFTNDFRDFLKQQGMAMDQPTRNDFSILELYLNGGERIEGMMKDSRNQLKVMDKLGIINWAKEEKEIYNGFRAFYEQSKICNWGVRARDPYAFVEWGVVFPNSEREQSLEWSKSFVGVPNIPFLYMAINATDANERGIIRNMLPDPWITKLSNEDTNDWASISCRPLYEVFKEKSLTEAWNSWLVDRFSESLEALDQH